MTRPPHYAAGPERLATALVVVIVVIAVSITRCATVTFSSLLFGFSLHGACCSPFSFLVFCITALFKLWPHGANVLLEHIFFP